jgi:hypothetical protein
MTHVLVEDVSFPIHLAAHPVVAILYIYINKIPAFIFML